MSNDTPTLNGTISERGRERGSGDVAREIVIEEINLPPPLTQTSVSTTNPSSSDNTSTYHRTPLRHKPQLRIAPHDGRVYRNQRSRHCNSSILSTPTLPSSTGMVNSVNVDRMETGYHYIAQSINNLAYQQRIGRGVDITHDILENVIRRSDMRNEGADEDVIYMYDLHAKRRQSIVYNNYFSEQFGNMVNSDNAISTS